ncbi:MAG: hypothetical protein MJE77_02320 [Proteobacteria bacterium]|nr:hypothetical protein [Pseudomonadota bacterium]
MLAADIEIADIEQRHWAGWFELLIPPGMRSARPAVDHSTDDLSTELSMPSSPCWALVLLERDQPIRITVNTWDRSAASRVTGGYSGEDKQGSPGGAGWSGRESVCSPTLYTGTSPHALGILATELAVDAVVVLDCAILPEIYADIESTLDLSADWVAQTTVVLRAVKKYSGRGIWTEPGLLDLLPAVSYEALQSTFDLLIPDRTSMIAYIFDDRRPQIYASVIAVKQGGHISRVATHRGIARDLAEAAFARDWRRRYPEFIKLVTQRYAPPSVAVFMQREAFYRVAAGPTDQLAREMSARNVVIDPAPAWLLGLLGGATMAAFATRGAKALARVLPSSARKLASELATTAQAVIRDSGAHPLDALVDVLGFDPIELWHRTRHFYRREL